MVTKLQVDFNKIYPVALGENEISSDDYIKAFNNPDNRREPRVVEDLVENAMANPLTERQLDELTVLYFGPPDRSHAYTLIRDHRDRIIREFDYHWNTPETTVAIEHRILQLKNQLAQAGIDYDNVPNIHPIDPPRSRNGSTPPA